MREPPMLVCMKYYVVTRLHPSSLIQVASLAYDLLGPSNVLRTLYENDDFREFLAAVLDLGKDGDRLYRSADPLGAW